MGIKRKHKPGGFTIIEVLIVLAIAGLILLIVFLAIPAAQRNARNVARKHAVDYIAAQVATFYTDHGQFPYNGASGDLRTDFVNELKAEGPSKLYDIRFTTNMGSHNYPYSGPGIPGSPGDVDGEISIVPAHYCNRTPGVGPGDPDFPLTGTTTDMDMSRYAVYVVLEPSSQIYCIDSKN